MQNPTESGQDALKNRLFKFARIGLLSSEIGVGATFGGATKKSVFSRPRMKSPAHYGVCVKSESRIWSVMDDAFLRNTHKAASTRSAQVKYGSPATGPLG